jgi:biotin carboxyl carrier protein
MKFKVELGGQEKEIEVVRQGNRLRISYDDETTEARIVHQDGAHYVLEFAQEVGEHVQQRRLRAAGHKDGDERQLWVNGSLLTYRRYRERRAAGAATAGSLAASIPAVVSEILVAPGDAVHAGDKLILLESMKMIMPIHAPHDGIVEALHCKVGEAVKPGVPLLALAQPDDA